MPEKIRIETDTEFEDLLHSYDLPPLEIDVDSVIGDGRRIRRRRRVAGLAATTAAAVVAAGAWAVLPGRPGAFLEPASSTTTTATGLRPGHQRITLEPANVQDSKGMATTEGVTIDLSYGNGTLTVAGKDWEQGAPVDPQVFAEGGGQVFRLSPRSELIVTSRDIRDVSFFGTAESKQDRGATTEDIAIADTGLRAFVVRGVGTLPDSTGFTTYDGSRVMNQALEGGDSAPVRPPQAALDGAVLYYDRDLRVAGRIGDEGTSSLKVSHQPLREVIPLLFHSDGKVTTSSGFFAADGTPRDVSFTATEKGGRRHEVPVAVTQLEPDGPWAWTVSAKDPAMGNQWTLTWTDAGGTHTKTF